jgi:RNA polymerase sigma-70 factor (ECF subfamily)
MGGHNSNAEQLIESACRERDFARAATCAVEAYGPEILSFLVARLRSESDGEEAFGMFAEDLWKGLPQFEFRCSARGYLYTLARNAATRCMSAPQKRRQRNHTFADSAAVSAVLVRTRSETALHKRTEVKDKVRALRTQLAPEDQMLVTLYVDRRLPWREIAMVMSDSAQPADDDDALTRESARLRKRFERVKADLKELAQKAGLFDA